MGDFGFYFRAYDITNYYLLKITNDEEFTVKLLKNLNGKIVDLNIKFISKFKTATWYTFFIYLNQKQISFSY